MNTFYMIPEGDALVTPQSPPHLYTHQAPFSVVLLGTGCPETVVGRSSPATLVQYRGHYFLVDVGEGTLHRIAEAGLRCGDINNVLFTHHHADHNAGYPYFLINSWMNGRTELNLVGPPDTRKFHQMFLDFYQRDIEYRSTRRGMPLAPMYQPNLMEIEDEAQFALAGVSIRTAKLCHTEHNIGYRFTVDGTTIVVSGDSSYTPALIDLAKDADILVMDTGAFPNTGYLGASVPVAMGEPPILPPKKNEGAFEAPPHPAKGELVRIAVESGVKTLVLTHFMPFLPNSEAITKQLREGGYQGNIVLGRDLMEIIP